MQSKVKKRGVSQPLEVCMPAALSHFGLFLLKIIVGKFISLSIILKNLPFLTALQANLKEIVKTIMFVTQSMWAQSMYVCI